MKSEMDTPIHKKLLLRVLDDSPLGVAVWQWRSVDPDPAQLFLLYSNHAGDVISNFSLSEHVGHSIKDIFPGFSASEHIALYFESLTKQIVYSYEVMGTEKFSSQQSYRLDLRPIDKAHLLVSFEDISEVQQLTNTVRLKLTEIEKKEKEINLMRKLSEYSSDAIFIVDLNTARLLDCNKTASEKTGYAKNEILSKTVLDLDEKVHSIEQWQAMVEATRGKSSVEMDSCLVCKHGDRLPVDISARLVIDNENEFIIASIRDSRERKVYQEKMEKAQADIAHILRLATINEFASEIAHELNQPLAAIVAYAQGICRRLESGLGNITNLSEYVEQNTSEDKKSMFQTYVNNGFENVELLTKTARAIEEQAIRSSKVIERVREFVKKSDLVIELIDVRKSIELAVELMRPLAKSLNIIFELRLGPEVLEVLVDKIHIEQVLVNIIKNALEAMTEVPDERRQLLVQALRLTGDAVQVIVRDFGHGFDIRDADSLFANYYSTKQQGLGVGLSISRNLVEANGGRLVFIGKKDKGACMQMTLKSASNANFICEQCVLRSRCNLL
ncbi:MAG: PAS domain S-box protein [Coxiellaceae bacterium]|nr:PAS domain S-box protein [Coxiellaceae bacterium]